MCTGTVCCSDGGILPSALDWVCSVVIEVGFVLGRDV